MKRSIFLFLLVLIVFAIYFINNHNKEISIISSSMMSEVDDDELWIEVSLVKNDNRVIVREGHDIIKEMPCSGGTMREPTVTGIFYIQTRGDYFYSERFKQGGYYWIRFYEQYLFHSVPFDEDYNIIEEEEEKIGKWASHGCIRLLLEDAEWFYVNVPDGTLVVIHY